MTAYDMRMSDWSSDVCSSDLAAFIEVDTARRRIEVQFQRPRSMIARRLHKSCRRIDRARRADGHEQISLGQRLIDPLHFIWHFAEEHDVRPQLRRPAVPPSRTNPHFPFPFPPLPPPPPHT